VGVDPGVEMRCVLKPGGELLFSEHGRAPDPRVRAWQQRLQPPWTPLARGCQLDRDISALRATAGSPANRPRATCTARTSRGTTIGDGPEVGELRVYSVKPR
jgi:hypothetical protein